MNFGVVNLEVWYFSSDEEGARSGIGLNDTWGFLNKTGTSQVGAISKAQKAQKIFFGKKLEIFEKKILSENVAQCRKM